MGGAHEVELDGSEAGSEGLAVGERSPGARGVVRRIWRWWSEPRLWESLRNELASCLGSMRGRGSGVDPSRFEGEAGLVSC